MLTVFNDSTASLYLKDVVDFNGLVFENNIQGPIETAKLPFSEYLRLIAGNTMGIIGISGIILWGIANPKYFIALIHYLFYLFIQFPWRKSNFLFCTFYLVWNCFLVLVF